MVRLIGNFKLRGKMQIEVQETAPCILSVQYSADNEEISSKKEEVLNLFKKAPCPGFRKGKASLTAIKVHYKSQIEESLRRALAEEAYHNVLFEKKIKPHGAPQFSSLLLIDNKFTCEFTIHTRPDFELAPFIGMEIPKPHGLETETELSEKLLQELRVRYGEAMPYTETDFVQLNDNVIIDYEGYVDGQKVDHICATGELLTVGSSNFVQFDNNLLGMSIGDVREFDIDVPSSGLASMAGKKIHIKATLTMGSKIEPCPLDDSLAIKLGKENISALREFCRQTAAVNLQSKFKDYINSTISDILVSSNAISVPNWMSLSEAQYLVHNSKMDWHSMPDADKEQYLSLAEKNVKLSLILDKIREQNPEAQLTEQEVFDIVKDNLSKTHLDKPIDEVIQQMNKNGYLQILFARIKDEFTMDFISKSVKIIE